jgi:transcriptional regulator with XRE-family HTH domain
MNELTLKKRIHFLARLADVARAQGITQDEWAERSGLRQSNIARILSGKYPPTLDTLITLANAVGYEIGISNIHPITTNSIIDPFLLAVDYNNKEIYILHREYPSCLIWVKQETPLRFILMDLYDDVEDVNSILLMPFIENAKQYFYKQVEKGFDLN